MRGAAPAPAVCRRRQARCWAYRSRAAAARCVCGGGQDAMVSDQVEARWRYQGGQFFYQFQWRVEKVFISRIPLGSAFSIGLIDSVQRLPPPPVPPPPGGSGSGSGAGSSCPVCCLYFSIRCLLQPVADKTSPHNRKREVNSLSKLLTWAFLSLPGWFRWLPGLQPGRVSSPAVVKSILRYQLPVLSFAISIMLDAQPACNW